MNESWDDSGFLLTRLSSKSLQELVSLNLNMRTLNTYPGWQFVVAKKHDLSYFTQFENVNRECEQKSLLIIILIINISIFEDIFSYVVEIILINRAINIDSLRVTLTWMPKWDILLSL